MNGRRCIGNNWSFAADHYTDLRLGRQHLQPVDKSRAIAVVALNVIRVSQLGTSAFSIDFGHQVALVIYIHQIQVLVEKRRRGAGFLGPGVTVRIPVAEWVVYHSQVTALTASAKLKLHHKTLLDMTHVTHRTLSNPSGDKHTISKDSVSTGSSHNIRQIFHRLNLTSHQQTSIRSSLVKRVVVLMQPQAYGDLHHLIAHKEEVAADIIFITKIQLQQLFSITTIWSVRITLNHTPVETLTSSTNKRITQDIRIITDQKYQESIRNLRNLRD